MSTVVPVDKAHLLSNACLDAGATSKFEGRHFSCKRLQGGYRVVAHKPRVTSEKRAAPAALTKPR